MLAGFYSEQRQRKAHFAFTYLLLGSNLALAALATSLVQAIFREQPGLGLGTVALMLGLCAGLYWYARRTQSYWFLVLAAGYAYFAACYVLVQVVMLLPEAVIVMASFILFPISALLVVLFFINLKKIMHRTDGPTPSPTQQP
jgi:hypothetical protein